MRAALLLVDFQHDYLDLAGIEPHPAAVCASAGTLLAEFRSLDLPVVHVWTTIRDERERMPHWRSGQVERCVAGTTGHATPTLLVPLKEELVVDKRYYTAFESDELLDHLQQHEIDTVVIAGVLLRACVRTTAIDAYQRGLRVVIAEDAVGDNDPTHAAVTRQYLEQRFVRFLTAKQVVSQLRNGPSSSSAGQQLPAAIVSGSEIEGSPSSAVSAIAPRDGVTPAFSVLPADERSIAVTVQASRTAFGEWEQTDIAQRRSLLSACIEALERNAEPLVSQIVTDIGKPLVDARGEVEFTLALMRAALDLSDEVEVSCTGKGWRAARRPHGVLLAITPWNNPLAIAVGKIVPALLHGNVVIWKPAVHGARVATVAMHSFFHHLPPGVVNLVNGDHRVAERLIREADAVTLTGSSAAGAAVQASVSNRRIPLQAELGGNNGAIVWSDTDLEHCAHLIAASAFSCAGQRCTAPRRIIVDQRCLDEFAALFESEVSRLEWGDPDSEQTQVGPVISAQSVERLAGVVERFQQNGGSIVQPQQRPKVSPECQRGYYFPPTIAFSDSFSEEIVRTETFGPIVVVQSAASFDQAVELCNGVPQGLVASLFSDSDVLQRRFESEVRAGILKVNTHPAGVCAEAPFCGWGNSAIGPPEHGLGDIEFHTRWQVIYQ